MELRQAIILGVVLAVIAAGVLWMVVTNRLPRISRRRRFRIGGPFSTHKPFRRGNSQDDDVRPDYQYTTHFSPGHSSEGSQDPGWSVSKFFGGGRSGGGGATASWEPSEGGDESGPDSDHND